jgi:RimJ/RimL family protein N-acetyltransferase
MIESKRLILRPWTEADKPAFHDIINTPAMMVHFGGVAERAKIDKLIDSQMEGQRNEGFSMWAVETKADGALAGICGLRRSPVYADTPVGGMLEIGWRVAEPLWGTGVAREAAEASMAWGWANTDDPKIVAWTGQGNMRSWGLMLRLGMTRREALDFHHPFYAADEPLGAMIVYGVERPA